MLDEASRSTVINVTSEATMSSMLLPAAPATTTEPRLPPSRLADWAPMTPPVRASAKRSLRLLLPKFIGGLLQGFLDAPVRSPPGLRGRLSGRWGWKTGWSAYPSPRLGGGEVGAPPPPHVLN